ncbi:MAG: HEAT repeat protein [Hyphomicrobiaceae bacterium]|jgi:HEAT repeat protein
MNPSSLAQTQCLRHKRSVTALLVASVCLLTTTLLTRALPAHGGQYRGPTNGGVPGNPQFPGGSGNPGLVPGGPLTGGSASLDVANWRVWWGLNSDRYVRPKSASKVTDIQRSQHVLPSLKAALDATDNPDINSACLIALGKAAIQHPEFDVLEVLRTRLKRANLEVREAAVLAMGLTGRSDVFDDLDGIMRNTKAGRKLVGRDSVEDRARTFAAYSLGMLANRSTSTVLKTQVLGSFVAMLEDKSIKDRDLLTGVLNGMRLLGPNKDKRLLWQATGAIEAHQQRRMRDKASAVQSHGLTALAALLGRGNSSAHERAKELMADVLKSRSQETTTYISAIIALGEIVSPDDKVPMDALLRAVSRPSDSLMPKFGMIAFGKIGGKVCREQLERAFKRGKRDVRPWAAIGLGLLAFHEDDVIASPTAGTAARPAKGALAASIGKFLHKEFNGEKKEMQAAIAIALGLASYKVAAPDLRKLATKYMSNEPLAGPLCLGLAMMKDTPSIPLLLDGMQRVDRPVLFGQAALALSRLDRTDASAKAVATLQAMTRIHPMFLRQLAAAAQAIGHLRNPKDIDSLAAIVGDTKRSKRDIWQVAFAAAALGSVADHDPVGFGTRIAHGMNYTARVQTISNGRNGILDIF